jgi:di/tricarboxylate transporter
LQVRYSDISVVDLDLAGGPRLIVYLVMFSTASNTPYVPLLSWKKAQECVPWNIILLLGGGFAMAKGCEVNHRIYI